MDFKLDDALSVLERTPPTLSTLLSGLPPLWVLATEGEGSWSPFDVLGHLIHGERTDWIPRTRQILAGDTRPFEPFDRNAQFAQSRGKGLDELLETVVILKNWQSIGEQPRVKTGWAWLAVSVAMVIVFGATYWVHLIYLLTWSLAWPMKQARYVNERWGANYPKKRWVAPLLVGLGVVVALAVALVGWLVVLQV